MNKYHTNSPIKVLVQLVSGSTALCPGQHTCPHSNMLLLCKFWHQMMGWHPLNPLLSCQMIKAPKAQHLPKTWAGIATLSALHRYLLAFLPGCNLKSFTMLIVSLDLMTGADLFMQLFYTLCEGHVIFLPEKANALHFLEICLMKCL